MTTLNTCTPCLNQVSGIGKGIHYTSHTISKAKTGITIHLPRTFIDTISYMTTQESYVFCVYQ